jgi:dCMP deaminase
MINMVTRISKRDWYFQIAKDVALRAPCGNTRRGFGAILVKNDAIIATGYAGSARGTINCGIDSPCLKDLYQEDPDKSYDHCCSIHAEQNCIINAARAGISTVEATLYLSEVHDKGGRPCFLCRRFMIQAGIKDCYWYEKKISKNMHRIGVLNWTNVEFPVYHEECEAWIKSDNEWIQEQLNKAPK